MGVREGTTLTILSGQTESDVLDLSAEHGQRLIAPNIGAPATLTGTVKVYVKLISGGDFYIQQDGGADLALAAGGSTQILGLAALAIKLVSSAAEGADRTFAIKGHDA